MLHTRHFAFIHFQKTAGMSMTRYLINALDDPVTVFSAEKSFANTRKMAISADRAAKLTCVAGNRHETPAEAIATMERHGLTVPPHAFVMIRHPVDLMLSYYKHLRKPRVWQHRGMNKNSMSGQVKFAVENEFGVFARRMKFYGKDDNQVMEFFEPAGFARLDVVPLERVQDYLPLRFSGQKNFAEAKLEHHNRSDDGRKSADLDPDTRNFIRNLYPRTEAAYEAAMAARWDR